MNCNANSKGVERALGGLACLAIVSLLAIAATAAAETGTRQAKIVVRGAERSAPVTPYIFDGDLRDLPRPVNWKPGDPVKEIPRRAYLRPGAYVPRDYETGRDTLMDLQQDAQSFATEAFSDLTRNFPGQGYSGVNPPDTVGEAGPNHYIQMINDSSGTRVAIYDKATPTPNLVTTFILDTLGADLCDSGYGDPIVLYDRYSERWMLSEFSRTGNNMCVYISQTDDPVSGGWYFYGFEATYFPDYPKYAIWPTDANGGQGSIIVTSNESGPPAGYAMDRGAMLVGDPATLQRVTFPELPGFSFQTTTPADPDGVNAPPATAPVIIMRHRDTENHDGPAAPGDLLEMWTFDVDWVNAANTTLTQEPSIDVAEFDSDLCGLTAFYCFPQPGTSTTLDPLREVIMWRLQYMNYGEHEALSATSSPTSMARTTEDCAGSSCAAAAAGPGPCTRKAPTPSTAITAGWAPAPWTSRATSPSPTTSPRHRPTPACATRAGRSTIRSGSWASRRPASTPARHRTRATATATTPR